MLMKGNSPGIISENIRTLTGQGRPETQAIAASYTAAGKGHKKKKRKKIVPPLPADDSEE